MKRLLFMMFLAAIIGTTSFAQNREVKKANDKVNQAKREKDEVEAENKVQKAQSQADEEWAEYKRDAENRIAKNEAKIDELRSKQTADPTKQRRYYEKIDKLEAENSAIRSELNAYDPGGKTAWQDFKKKMDRRMDKLEDGFREATE